LDFEIFNIYYVKSDNPLPSYIQNDVT